MEAQVTLWKGGSEQVEFVVQVPELRDYGALPREAVRRQLSSCFSQIYQTVEDAVTVVFGDEDAYGCDEPDWEVDGPYDEDWNDDPGNDGWVEDPDDDDSEACPGCGAMPGDGLTEGCDHPEGCGYWREIYGDDPTLSGSTVGDPPGCGYYPARS